MLLFTACVAPPPILHGTVVDEPVPEPVTDAMHHDSASAEDACVSAAFRPGAEVRLDAGDAQLFVPGSAFAIDTTVTLCRAAPGEAKAAPLSDGWDVGFGDEDLASTSPLELTLHGSADPASAAYVPGPNGSMRSLQAVAAGEGALTAPIYRPGLAWLAADERPVVPYVPEPVAVDLLLVVDDTIGLLDEQFKLGNTLPPVLDALDGHGVDYRVGVVTTDATSPAGQGRLVSALGERWVGPATEGRDEVLGALVSVGNEGDEDEQGLATLTSALFAGWPENAGFLRPDADLAVVVVSNADDHSGLTGSDVAELLAGIGRPQVLAHSLVATKGDDAGLAYLALSDALGGSTADIDVSDWAVFFDEVADEELIRSAMRLPPAIASLTPEVWLVPAKGEQIPCQRVYWDAEEAALACLDPMPSGSEPWVIQN